MKRAFAKRHDSHNPERTQPAVPIGATDREIQLSLDRDELLGLMQDSLESLALKLGMLVVSSLLEDEVTRLCGPRHERQPHRTHTRYGHQPHVPEKHHAALERRLSEAYHETGYEAAKASLEATARWLERINPDAASSLREGLEETLTVVRLGLAGALRRTLATTNPIESALSVTRWRDGEMRRRWCVAGLLRAEAKFRRVKGHRAMPALIKALEESTRARGSGIERGGA